MSLCPTFVNPADPFYTIRASQDGFDRFVMFNRITESEQRALNDTSSGEQPALMKL